MLKNYLFCIQSVRANFLLVGGDPATGYIARPQINFRTYQPSTSNREI